MVAAAQESAASPAVRARARRQRDEELLVWPDLVFIEFIAAVVFTLSLTALSILINAPLLDRANPGVTPNPSKAPWYFLNLQELLLHMHPALAGVIVPTVALIALGAIPYFDRSHEGQGEWLSTPRAKLNVIVGAATGTIGSLLLIIWDSSKHVVLWARLTGNSDKDWPSSLNWLRSARALQTEIAWPEELEKIPLGEKVLRTDLLGLPKVDLNVNLPALIVEQLLPTTLMIGLPLLMAFVLHRRRIAQTKRDHMIAQFSGFIAVYVVLTIIGTAFRGQGMELLWPQDVVPPVS
jgi:quinol-cytochrome oxidoreductase complex cytochrome b subunit